MKRSARLTGQLLLGTVMQLFLLNWLSLSQTTTGSIVGAVRDASGRVVSNAAITVTNEKSGEAFSRSTDSQGNYAFTTLIPGTYRLHSELAGFKQSDIRGIVLQVDQTARFDLTLQIGQVTESITVTASAPVLSRDTSDIGQVIDEKQVVDLPLNGRNFLQLASLTNGVHLQGNTESGGPQFTSDGNRTQQNSFLIDGVETRIQREGGYGVNLSIDAIQEFKILQNTFSAEYGRATAVVDVVVRSGTNSLHGTAFEFLRNYDFDARNAFDVTGTKPPLRQNQFGGSLGGPVLKDKLFYFVDYEAIRAGVGSTQFSLVPTPAVLSGNLTGLKTAIDPSTGQPFPNNQIPAGRISQFAKATAAYYPAPNNSNFANLNYVAILTNRTSENQGTGRADYLLSQKNRIDGHYTGFYFDTQKPAVLPFAGTSSYAHARNLTVEYIHTFSPSLLNTFRFGYSNTNTFSGGIQTLKQSVTDAFGLKNLSPTSLSYFPPNVGISGGYGTIGGPAFSPTESFDINHQFVDQMQYIRGIHSLKFGADLRLLTFNDLGYATLDGQYTFNGQYTGNPAADFLLGIPNYVYVDQVGPNASVAYQTNNAEMSFYLQDDIRVSRSLTINAGLRYEYVQWPKEKHDEFASWDFQKGALDIACKDIPCRVAPPYKNGWSPRLGVAYTPFRKTVIRTGAAIVYSNFRQWEVSLFHFTPPFIYEYFLNNNVPVPSFTTATLWPAVPQNLSQADFTLTTVNYQNPDKILPKTYQWNFGVQQELLPNLLLEVRYVGNRGVHLPVRYDGNAAVQDANLLAPTPIQSRRPYKNVGFVSSNSSDGWSSYNALDVRVERRFSGGLSVLGTYTWGKSLGLVSGSDCCYTVFDFSRLRLNYGPVGDYAHRAVISYLYALPIGAGKALNLSNRFVNAILGGWQVNGITTFQSGVSLSVSTSVSNNLGNRAGNYASCIGDPHIGNPTQYGWFSKAAFHDPVFGTYGNCGEGVLRGPGLVNFDMSVFKNARIRERATVQFRVESFNVFNHKNLNNPDVNVDDANFGRIVGSAPGRIVQLGAKILF